MAAVPLCLTALRFLLAAPVVLLALFAPLPGAFGVCLIAAFLSDVFDGIVARRLGIASEFLRRADSIADTVFYAAAIAAVWIVHPQVIEGRWPILIALLGLEISRYALDFARFGREASYHMWSSKLWGLLLFAAFFAVLALERDGWIVDVAISIGILADLEGIAISLILPTWRHDVPSLVHAWRLRARTVRG